MTALTEHLQRHAPATARVTVHQGEHDDAERGLHLRVLEEQVLHHTGVGVALEDNDHAHTFAVGLVADIGDVGDGPVLDQLDGGLDFAAARR